MEDTLEILKSSSLKVILSPLSIMLKESRLKLKMDLFYLRESRTGMNNDQIITLKDKLAEDYDKIER